MRKGEKGTPIMYADFRQRRTARDEQSKPIRDEEGRAKLEWVQRDRPLVKLHYVFNVEQTEGLKLRSLETAAPKWEGHERAEALINASGVRVDHGAGDRAYYSLKDTAWCCPTGASSSRSRSNTHTALHELGHATGHPDRLEPADPSRPRGLRLGNLRPRGVAGGDRRDDDRRAARRRARAAAWHRVRQLVD